MRWDEVLERLKVTGHDPEELDFMENYGPIVRKQYPALTGRHVRCIFGAARVRRGTGAGDGVRFESYLFASDDDAEEFRQLVGEETSWGRVRNMVIHTAPDDLTLVEGVLLEALGQERSPGPGL
jgi:hypothetical protein